MTENVLLPLIAVWLFNQMVLKTIKRDFAVWKWPDVPSHIDTKGKVLSAYIRVPLSRSRTVVRFPLLARALRSRYGGRESLLQCRCESPRSWVEFDPKIREMGWVEGDKVKF